MTHTTGALVGAAGGAGTTRTTLEAAAVLAADGAEVAVLDAAYATQGLSAYLPGRLDPDVTALVTDRRDAPLSAGLVDLELDAEGRVACCPAAAPFERLARAKSVEAARAFEARIEAAASSFDHVLVDVPPLGSNQAVAAATACERVALVRPPGDRGRDAGTGLRERVADVGASVDVAVTVRGTDAGPADGLVLPATEADLPAALSDERYREAVTSLVASLLDREVRDLGESAGLLGGVGDRVRRR
jgi:cellulose biosynthesis protein BcsQ